MRRRRLLPVLALALLLLPLPAAGAQQRPDSVRLRFDWPMGVVVDLANRRINVVENVGKRDSTDNIYGIRLRPVEGRGGTRLIRITGFIPGNSAGRIDWDALSRNELPLEQAPTIVLDSTGNVAEVRNAEQVAEVMRRSVQGSMDSLASTAAAGAGLLATMSSPEYVQERILNEWSFAVGAWVDADLEVGQWVALEDTVRTAYFKDVPFPATLGFLARARVECGDGEQGLECVELVNMQEVEDEAARKAIESFVRRLAKDAPRPPAVDSFSVLRRTVVVTHPSSLVAHSMLTVTQTVVSTRAGKQTARYKQRQLSAYHFTFAVDRPRLLVAAERGLADTVAALVQQGTPVDQSAANGATPLYAAASAGHVRVTELLLKAGADPGLAYEFGRRSGDVGAMRALRPHLRAPVPPAGTLDAAAALVEAGRGDEAVMALADIAVSEAEPATGHAMLARLLASRDARTRAVPLARAVLSRDRCSRPALESMIASYDQDGTDKEIESADTALVYARRFTECHPRVGLGWMVAAWHLERLGDTVAAASALDRLRALEQFTPAAIQVARWKLGLAPRNGIWVTDDAYGFTAMRLAQRLGHRPDVAVVHVNLLSSSGFAAALRARHGVVVPSGYVSAAGAGGAEVRRAGFNIVRAWRDQSVAGALKQPLAIGIDVAGDSIPGAGELRALGPYAAVSPAAAPKAQLSAIWEVFAALPPGLEGMHGGALRDTAGVMNPGDDVATPILVGALVYLGFVDLWKSLPTVSELDHVDSLLAWTERNAAAVPVIQEWIHRELARQYTSLSSQRSRFADLDRADQAARRAIRLDPSRPTAWNNLGYTALGLGNFQAADSALRRAYDLSPELTTLLNLSTVARYKNRPDSAVMWLERAIAWATPERVAHSDMENHWTVMYLPLRPGDRETIRKTAVVASREEKVALIFYNLSLALAMQGKRREADQALEKAMVIAPPSDRMRCYIAGLMQSARGFGLLSRGANAWVLQSEKKLACASS